MVIYQIQRANLKRSLDNLCQRYLHDSFWDYVQTRINFKIIKDGRYSFDNKKMEKRICIDAYTECFMNIFTSGEYIPDFSVGQSKNYNIPDLQSIGLEVGIKSAHMPNAHLIQKPDRVKYPELLIHVNTNDNDYVEFRLYGLATVEVMVKYADDSLVLDKRALKYKTAFNSYDQCKEVYTFEMLKKVYGREYAI